MMIMMAIKMMTMMMKMMMTKMMSWPDLMANAARKIGNVDPKVVSLRLKMVVSLSGRKRPSGTWKSPSRGSKMGSMGIVGPSSQPEQRPLTIVAIIHPLNQPFWHCCNTSITCHTSFKPLKSEPIICCWNVKTKCWQHSRLLFLLSSGMDYVQCSCVYLATRLCQWYISISNLGTLCKTWCCNCLWSYSTLWSLARHQKKLTLIFCGQSFWHKATFQEKGK